MHNIHNMHNTTKLFSPLVGVLVQEKLTLLKNGVIDTSKKNYLMTSSVFQIELLNSETQLVQTNPLALVDTSIPGKQVIVLAEDKEGR